VAWERSKLGELLTKKARETGQGKSLATVVDEYVVSARFLRKAHGTQRREKSAAQAVMNRWSGNVPARRPWSDRPIELVDATDINAYIGLRMAVGCLGVQRKRSFIRPKVPMPTKPRHRRGATGTTCPV
jgi:hypothetical protein